MLINSHLVRIPMKLDKKTKREQGRVQNKCVGFVETSRIEAFTSAASGINLPGFENEHLRGKTLEHVDGQGNFKWNWIKEQHKSTHLTHYSKCFEWLLRRKTKIEFVFYCAFHSPTEWTFWNVIRCQITSSCLLGVYYHRPVLYRRCVWIALHLMLHSVVETIKNQK